jgi:hypothetical protein
VSRAQQSKPARLPTDIRIPPRVSILDRNQEIMPMIYPASKTRPRPLWLSHFTAALALIATPAFAVGQTYPRQPIRLAVPFDAGGGVNLAARLLLEQLNPALGNQIIVENRPGAGGKIEADAVSRTGSQARLAKCLLNRK